MGWGVYETASSSSSPLAIVYDTMIRLEWLSLVGYFMDSSVHFIMSCGKDFILFFL